MNWAQPTISGAMIWVREEDIRDQDSVRMAATCAGEVARLMCSDGVKMTKAFVQRGLPEAQNYHHVLSRGTRQLNCAQLSHCAIWLRIRGRNRQFVAMNS